MVTLFKNLQLILTTLGDQIFYHYKLSEMTLLSLSLMSLGSLVACFNDMEFNLVGCLFIVTNCFFGTAYTLYMKATIQKTNSEHVSSVYYNNLISIPLLFPLSLLWESHRLSIPLSFDWIFFASFLYSGFCGAALSASTMWTLRMTSSTTFSIVGALNKIPLTILSLLLFRNSITFSGFISIGIGLFGGLVYAYSQAQISVVKVRQGTHKE
jgi:GDP-mannose transporter